MPGLDPDLQRPDLQVLNANLARYNTARRSEASNSMFPSRRNRPVSSAEGARRGIERVDVRGGLINEYRRAA